MSRIALCLLSIAATLAHASEPSRCEGLLTEATPYAAFYPKNAVHVEREVTGRDRTLWQLSMSTRRHREFGSIELLDADGALLTWTKLDGHETTIDGEAIDAGLKRVLKMAARKGHVPGKIATIRLIHTHPRAVGGYVSIDYDFSPNDSRTAESYREQFDATPRLRHVAFEMQIIFREDDGPGITKRAFVLPAP